MKTLGVILWTTVITMAATLVLVNVTRHLEKSKQETTAFTDSIKYHPFYQIKIDAAGQCYMPVDCPEDVDGD